MENEGATAGAKTVNGNGNSSEFQDGNGKRGFLEGVFAKGTPLLAVPNVLLGPISLGSFLFPWAWRSTLQRPLC